MVQGSFRQFNIPYDEEEYKKGFGEKVWGMMEKNDNEKITNREKGVIIKVLICNNCIGFPSLKIGTVVHCELRGDLCPIITWEYVKDLQFNKEAVDINIGSLQIAYPCGECGKHFCSKHKIYLHHKSPFEKSGYDNDNEEDDDESDNESDDEEDDTDINHKEKLETIYEEDEETQ